MAGTGVLSNEVEGVGDAPVDGGGDGGVGGGGDGVGGDAGMPSHLGMASVGGLVGLELTWSCVWLIDASWVVWLPMDDANWAIIWVVAAWDC